MTGFDPDGDDGEPPLDPHTAGWRAELRRRWNTTLASIPGLGSAVRPGAGVLDAPPPRGLGTPDDAGEGSDGDDGPPLPRWLRLPLWLHQAWDDAGGGSQPGGDAAPGTVSATAASPGPPWLADVLWGQYALFLHVRLVDDLLDGDARDRRLHFVADRFLLESLDAFGRIDGLGPDFHAFCRDRLQETVDGILEVAALEEEPGAFTAARLPLHAKVSSIFRVGAVAVCHLLGRADDTGWIGALQDRDHVFGQILDDLADVGEDLARGRYTFVGNALLNLEMGDAASADGLERRLLEGMLLPSRAEPLWRELRRLAAEAAEVVPDAAPEPIHALVRSLRDDVGALDDRLHEARVRRVFGDDVVEAAGTS